MNLPKGSKRDVLPRNNTQIGNNGAVLIVSCLKKYGQRIETICSSNSPKCTDLAMIS